MEPRIGKKDDILPNTFSNPDISTSKKTVQTLKTSDQQQKVVSIFNDLAQQPRENLRPLPSPNSLPPQSPLPPPPQGMQPTQRRRELPPTPGTSFRAQGQVSGPPQRGLPSTPDSLPPQSPLPPVPRGMQPTQRRRELPPTPGTSFRAQGQVSGPPQRGLPSTPDSLPPQIPLPPPPQGVRPPRPLTPPPGTSIHTQAQVSGPPQSSLPPIPSDSPYKSVTQNYEPGENINDKLQDFAARTSYNKANELSDVSEKNVQVQNNSLTLPVTVPSGTTSKPEVRPADLAFQQKNVISEITSSDSTAIKSLVKINARFDGICELVCNKVLINNLLGAKNSSEELEKELTFDSFNNKETTKTHILSVMPAFNILLSLVSKYYPDNVFSHKDQSKLLEKAKSTSIYSGAAKHVYTINSAILEKKLETLPEGEVLKVMVFNKRGTEFSGHSLLLKKTGKDEFIFFDPSMGEFRNLNYKQLEIKINQELLANSGTDILFMKGSDYLKRLGIKPNS